MIRSEKQLLKKKNSKEYVCDKLPAQAHSQVITRVSYMWQICAVDQVLQLKASLLKLRGLTLNNIKNPALHDINSLLRHSTAS